MNKEPLWANQSPLARFWLLILIFTFCFFVFSFISTLVILPFADIKNLQNIEKLTDFNNPHLLTGLKIAQFISAIGIFIIPAYLFSVFTTKNKSEFFKINKKPSFFWLMMGVLIMLTAQPLINWMGELNQKLVLPHFMNGIEHWMKGAEESASKLTEAFLVMKTPGDLIVNLIMIALFAALGEELFFRGTVQRVLTDVTKNTDKAIWISAILFSAMHFQFYGFLPRMMMGVMLGYLFLWSGSLWVPIMAHFTNNALAVVVNYLSQKGIISTNIEYIGTTESYTTSTIISFIVVSGLLFLTYNYRKKKQME